MKAKTAPAGLLTIRHSDNLDCEMTTPDQIDLAHASAFRLGPITVEPALRQVTAVRSETLEPRVMQVLVVLAMANGGIVSRDDLVRQCWEGRIVGDDSITRVIARLRKLAAEHGDGAFRIETITKVGYRLVGPITLVASTQPEPLQVAGSAVERPKPEQSHRLSLRQWLAGGSAVLAAVAVSLFWSNRGTLPREAAPLTVVPFGTSGVPTGTAETLQSAMVSAIAPERFRVVGGTLPQAGYYLTGRLVGSPSEITVYPELHVPGVKTPIWSPQKTYPHGTLLKGIATQLTWTARCIVDGVNEPPLQKPAAATAGWASYCEENSKDVYDVDRQVEALRVATQAEPRFVTAQVTLAEFLGHRAYLEAGKAADTLRAEGRRAVALAEKIDPDNAEVYMGKAVLTVPSDFRGRDALFARVLSSRPTGWGFEFQHFAYFLDQVGRQRDALEARKRALAINPGNTYDILLSAASLSRTGRYQEARAIFADEARIRSDRRLVDRIWLRAALTGRDWDKAHQLVAALTDDRVRAAMAPLVAALAVGDAATARAAGAAFEPLAKDPATLSGWTALGLAISGRDQAAIEAVRRLFATTGPDALDNLYWPEFDDARRTPAFEALVREIRLFDYWQTSGHVPDFCLAADAPPLCAKLN